MAPDKSIQSVGPSGVTWEQVMASLRNPAIPDQQSVGDVRDWSERLAYSTQLDPEGKHVNYGDDLGWTMLFMAAYYDKALSVVELLLLGADPELRLTATRRTPLMVAEEESRDSAQIVLEAAGNRALLERWQAEKDIPRPKNYVAPETVNPSMQKLMAAKAAEKKRPKKDFDTQVTRLFRKHDRQHRGAIDTHEVRGIFVELKVKLSEEEVDQLVIKYDEDCSGHLDIHEFRELAKEAQLGDQAFIEQVRTVFHDCDLDGSGTVDVSEVGEALKALELDVVADEVDTLIQQYDVDGSGELDMNEFVNLARDAKEGLMAGADDDALQGGEWNQKEQALFLRGMKMYGEHWRRVAQVVQTRSAVQCHSHFKITERARRRDEGQVGEEEDDMDRKIKDLERQTMDEAERKQADAAEEARLNLERRTEDENRRKERRLEMTHDMVRKAMLQVYDKEYNPITIASWETEHGFRHYLRQYNIKRGTSRPASPRTRERLRKVFNKDKKEFYTRLGSLRKALVKLLQSPDYSNHSVFRLHPAEGVEAQAPIGRISSQELAEVLIHYGGVQHTEYGHKDFQKHIIPGTKHGKKDLFGDKWDLPFIVQILKRERSVMAEDAGEGGSDLF